MKAQQGALRLGTVPEVLSVEPFLNRVNSDTKLVFKKKLDFKEQQDDVQEQTPTQQVDVLFSSNI